MAQNRAPLGGNNYVDIRTASETLGVHPETLRRWEKKGTIKAKRLPSGHRRFLESDIKAVLAERESEAAAS